MQLKEDHLPVQPPRCTRLSAVALLHLGLQVRRPAHQHLRRQEDFRACRETNDWNHVLQVSISIKPIQIGDKTNLLKIFLVLGLVLEEGVLEELGGRGPLCRVLLQALADHLAEGLPYGKQIFDSINEEEFHKR